MKIAVVYQSKYGSTKQYATWLSEELNATLLERKSVKPQELLAYDLVIYGGGLYASGIAGVDLVTKNPCNKLIIFTVGAANPVTTDYSEIINKNIPQQLQSKCKIFHLRGMLDYEKLNLVHRGMMAMMKKMTVDKKANEEFSDEDNAFVDTYGKKADFTDKAAIKPIVDYVKTLNDEK